nr:putative Ulp1 protease family catalytic domain-containing protein [Ipomoea batatas]
MESGEKKAAEEMESMDNEFDGGSGRMIRPPSEASLCPTQDEEDFTPMGPKCSIKEHLIKDKARHSDHYMNRLGQRAKDLFNFKHVKCPQQPGGVECGYYVMKYML